MTSLGPRSGLCATGDPVEIGFVWPGGDVRVTVDPAPRVCPAHRLALCRAAVEERLSEQQRIVVAEIAGLTGGLSWGGWVGFRRRAGHLSRKLYIEIPKGATWREWEAHWAGSPAILNAYEPRPVMLGCEEGRMEVEIYQRLSRLCPHGLRLLLQRFGFADRLSEIVSALETLTGRRIHRELPTNDVGFSVSFRAPGQPEVLTLYSVAEALLGPAARCREALRAYGHQRGWNMSDYEDLTRPDGEGLAPHHGTVGLVLARGRELALAVGVALSHSLVEA